MEQTTLVRILVVEDEALMRRNIVRKISAVGPSFRVVGEAPNGKRALELIGELRPHVIFSDVNMPLMDGLELARVLREEQPDIRLVIISGHRDFEYARRAIQFGVRDYLLKPVEPETLEQVLRELGGDIQARRRGERCRHLGRILSGDTESADHQSYGLFHVLLGHRATGDLSAEQTKAFRTLWTRAQEDAALPGSRDDWFVFDGLRENEKLFLISSEAAPAGLPSLGEALLASLQAVVPTCPIHIGAAPRPVGEAELFSMRKTGSKSLYDHILVGRSACCEQTDEPAHRRTLLDAHTLQMLKTLAQNGDISALLKKIAQVTASWAQAPCRQRDYEAAVDHLLLMLAGVLPDSDDGRLDQAKRDILQQLVTEPDMTAATEGLLHALRALLATETGGSQQDICEKIEQYLQTHFAESLSMESLSRHFGFHFAHLSRLFKRYSGVTPLQYLTTLRIDRAAEMLRLNPEMDIRIVGQAVGYDDAHYFSRVFKNAFGMGPARYREKFRPERTDVSPSDSSETGDPAACL
ncbi:response regulator [Ruminococcaceae bacterium OttesenSCG-928-L11]|nr:response regulator [Ruminococcaceae bacterium OttesenSCG-928-L11]